MSAESSVVRTCAGQSTVVRTSTRLISPRQSYDPDTQTKRRISDYGEDMKAWYIPNWGCDHDPANCLDYQDDLAVIKRTSLPIWGLSGAPLDSSDFVRISDGSIFDITGTGSRARSASTYARTTGPTYAAGNRSISRVVPVISKHRERNFAREVVRPKRRAVRARTPRLPGSAFRPDHRARRACYRALCR
jgi:hypothetical protein